MNGLSIHQKGLLVDRPPQTSPPTPQPRTFSTIPAELARVDAATAKAAVLDYLVARPSTVEWAGDPRPNR